MVLLKLKGAQIVLIIYTVQALQGSQPRATKGNFNFNRCDQLFASRRSTDLQAMACYALELRALSSAVTFHSFVPTGTPSLLST